MSHRLQVTLDDEQYAWLRRRSAETGASLAELVRRSVEESARGGETGGSEARQAALLASAGAWKERDEDGAAYVERSRRRQ